MQTIKMMLLSIIVLSSVGKSYAGTNVLQLAVIQPVVLALPRISNDVLGLATLKYERYYRRATTTTLDLMTLSNQNQKLVDSFSIWGHQYWVSEGFVPFIANPFEDNPHNQELQSISARQIEFGDGLFGSINKGLGIHLGGRVDLSFRLKDNGGGFQLDFPLGKKKKSE